MWAPRTFIAAAYRAFEQGFALNAILTVNWGKLFQKAPWQAQAVWGAFSKARVTKAVAGYCLAPWPIYKPTVTLIVVEPTWVIAPTL